MMINKRKSLLGWIYIIILLSSCTPKYHPLIELPQPPSDTEKVMPRLSNWDSKIIRSFCLEVNESYIPPIDTSIYSDFDDTFSDYFVGFLEALGYEINNNCDARIQFDIAIEAVRESYVPENKMSSEISCYTGTKGEGSIIITSDGVEPISHIMDFNRNPSERIGEEFCEKYAREVDYYFYQDRGIGRLERVMSDVWGDAFAYYSLNSRKKDEIVPSASDVTTSMMITDLSIPQSQLNPTGSDDGLKRVRHVIEIWKESLVNQRDDSYIKQMRILVPHLIPILYKKVVNRIYDYELTDAFYTLLTIERIDPGSTHEAIPYILSVWPYLSESDQLIVYRYMQIVEGKEEWSEVKFHKNPDKMIQKYQREWLK